MFYQEEAPRGPGRKTRLKTEVSRMRFKKENDWTMDNPDDELNENWNGRNIFIVDRTHSTDHGTDQRRQKVRIIE